MKSKIKVGKKELGFLNLEIQNRYSGDFDKVLMDSDGALFNATTLNKVCEQNYFIDCDRMVKILKENF